MAIGPSHVPHTIRYKHSLLIINRLTTHNSIRHEYYLPIQCGEPAIRDELPDVGEQIQDSTCRPIDT